MSIEVLETMSPLERQQIKMNNVAKGVLTRLNELDPDKLNQLIDFKVKLDDPEIIEQLIKDEYLVIGRGVDGDYYISVLSLLNSVLSAGGFNRVGRLHNEDATYSFVTGSR